jgi:pimeloyl-ACP methyl ester carboxylesterase
MTHSKPQKGFCFLVLWLGLILPWSGTAAAEENIVAAKLPKGLTATAEYRPGKASSPAALILHGFLQTRNSITLATLANSASDAGYAVLMPTLSLGVGERKQSLQCDAIHTHTLDDDIAEIAFWVEWLTQRGHTDIVLIGHSFGSLHLLAYLQKHPNHRVRRFIATSLLDLSKDTPPDLMQGFVRQAKERAAKGDTSLGEYSLTHCSKYLAPAQAYLTYAAWSRERILAALRNAVVPVTVILGSEDKRLDANWPPALRAAKAEVIMIKRANHFFAADQEFDLLDTVHHLLENALP